MGQNRIIRPTEGTQAAAKSKYSELVDIDKNANDGLNNATGSLVASLLGSPTSEKVKSLLQFDNVGPFKVEGLIPALTSLKEVMTVVQNKYPELYTKLTHDGMRVVRNISGSKSFSMHAWGLAIDIKIDRVKDARFNDKALYGLTLIVPIFHEHGWYWGGAFRDKETSKGSGVYWSNEDAMHFEVSKEKLLEWQKAGLFGPVSKSRQETIAPVVSRPTNISSASHNRSMLDFLQKGDKGPNVVRLQNALKSHNYNITSDGRFGKNTETSLIDFQQKHGLSPNGIVGPKTALYLALF